MDASPDADHLTWGNALLLVTLTLEILHLRLNATAAEFEPELTAATGGEQTVHVHAGEAIQQQQR